ncbi:DUF3267 domain-containing protein [Paludicola sp. MB14-C6]|uniref:DUF3267 domain-containing protein n=1 Tax=Paludihabitans sp. MB14-C6 TaxID=3070656 RepID=UPI0027DC412D|nr:DUF3267 domain-containing protein [Paludicola sp. MB14-C6]WMJ23999.1 DUF3267 domain-containing protein [Paludicola sp. MB14-C6]
MKYVKQIPKTDFTLSNALQIVGWKRIKEPKNVLIATLISIPILLVNAFLTGGLFYILFPQVKELFRITSFSFTISILDIVVYCTASVVVLTVHEFFHAIWIPHFIQSDKTVWGITLLGGFVATTEKLSKARFIVISLFPFFALSILLPVILSLFNLYHPLFLFICILNAMGSCVDILNLILIAFQVPRKAAIINNGFETYYK